MDTNDIAYSPVLLPTDKYVLHSGGGQTLAIFDELVGHGVLTDTVDDLRDFVEKPWKWAEDVVALRGDGGPADTERGKHEVGED